MVAPGNRLQLLEKPDLSLDTWPVSPGCPLELQRRAYICIGSLILLIQVQNREDWIQVTSWPWAGGHC